MRALLVLAVVLGIFFSGCTLQCSSDINYVCGDDGVTYQNPCYAEQAGIRVNHTGECKQNVTPSTCYDSDNGKNLLEQGTTQVRGGTSPGQPYTDFCIGTTGVQEHFCENNEVKPESMTCPVGTACENGVCTAIRCSDSDGGYNDLLKGTVTKGSDTFTDYCNNTRTVVEYSCGTTNQVLSASVDCTAGYACSDGACARGETCTDTDGGYDIYERGTLTKDSTAYTDYCTDTYSVKEYSCSGTSLVETNVACGTGYTCSNGACAAEVCADSDGGRVKGTFGRVTRGISTWDDYCYDDNTVNEYYCEAGGVVSARLSCDSGEVCSGGVCRAPTCTDSDGGRRETVAGTLTIGSSTYSDYCPSLTTLREYYCSGTGYTYATVDCFTYFGTAKGICWNNICAQTYCSDSDGGQVKTTQGSSRMYTMNGYDTGWNNDACIDSRNVNEWYCDGNWRTNTTLMCDGDQVCSGGRCIEATCTDTDGGLNYYVAGNVTKGVVTQTDECKNSTTLKEYRCLSNNIDMVEYTCPGGCFIATGRCSPL